jgi:Fe-S cluster assembly ATP-binding protein
VTAHVLAIRDLHASVDGHEILHGVDLEVRSGEVHALMGPNGSGKSTLSHTLMGRHDYTVTRGSVTIDGEELLGRPTWERAAAGLFLAMQYPVEVPGVRLRDLLEAAHAGTGLDERLEDEAARLGLRPELLERGVNDEFSGGEKKRAETVQLAVLRPKFAVLDEIDSGLDVDALADVSRRIEAMTRNRGLGVLAITHYARLLRELEADRVHILLGGRIALSGGPELADRLEEQGYEGIAAELGVEELAVEAPAPADPFADPTLAATPFTGPDVAARRSERGVPEGPGEAADPFAGPLA